MDKCSIIIKERKKTASDRKEFTLFLRMKTWKFWKTWGPLTMQDILPKLVANLKGQGQVCYVLFSVGILPKEMCDSVVQVDKVRDAVSLAPEHLTIIQQYPKEIFMGWKDGVEKHLLVLKDETFKNIPRIVNLISCRDFECYLIIDNQANKDQMVEEIKRLNDNNSLKQKSIVSLSSEVVVYSLQNWTNQLYLHTTRFGLEQIKNIVRESVDLNKFEVVCS